MRYSVFPVLATCQDVECGAETVLGVSAPFLVSSEDQWSEINNALLAHPRLQLAFLGLYCPYVNSKEESPYAHQCFRVFEKQSECRSFCSDLCSELDCFDLSTFKKEETPFAKAAKDHSGGDSNG